MKVYYCLLTRWWFLDWKLTYITQATGEFAIPQFSRDKKYIKEHSCSTAPQEEDIDSGRSFHSIFYEISTNPGCSRRVVVLGVFIFLSWTQQQERKGENKSLEELPAPCTSNCQLTSYCLIRNIREFQCAVCSTPFPPPPSRAEHKSKVDHITLETFPFLIELRRNQWNLCENRVLNLHVCSCDDQSRKDGRYCKCLFMYVMPLKVRNK